MDEFVKKWLTIGKRCASICKSSSGRQKRIKKLQKTRKNFLTKRSEYDNIIKLRDERPGLERDKHKKNLKKLEKSS